tara:strand:+ start:595 stop:1347 length:753 start_codon:yes stop_codon:yes gene_type:complete
MYRISNDNTFTGKTELQKSYLVFTGKNNFTENISDDWKRITILPDGSRLYYSKFIGQLHIFKKPLDNSYFDLLCNALDNCKTNSIHPSLNFNKYDELKRLHPNSKNSYDLKYREFVEFLKDKYSIHTFKNDKTANFIDDIGPYLTPRVGIQKTVIPEFPKVYIAPSKWRLMSWIISNYFVGPFPKNNKGIYYRWNGFDISKIVKSNEDRAYMLLLISNFIIRHDSWAMRNDCDSMINFIDLVVNNNILPF